MPTTPPSISALPSAPDPTNRATFNTLAYPWSAALPTFGTQVSAVAANVKANADEAAASAISAAVTQADTAVAAAAQVAAAAAQAVAAASSAALAGATAWVSGTTYSIGDARYSLLDWLVYRRITAGAGTTDPKNDATNWICASIQPVPIGTVMPMVNVTTNPLTTGAQTWLKTGTVAARATYPNGPPCVTAVGAIDKPITVVNTGVYISYTNGLFVITAQSGTGTGVWTSADGLTYSYYPFPANVTAGNLTYCTYGSGKYVFQQITSPATAVVYTTTDFVTYTAVTLPNTAYCANLPSLTFTNSLFVYCCSNTSVAYLYTSPDGTTWTQQTLPNSAAYYSAAYGNGRWFVGCSGVTAHGAQSTNGTAWTAVAYSTNQIQSPVIYANGVFIALGNAGTALTSTTGTSAFTPNSLPGTPGDNTKGLAWTGTTFQATGATGALYSSASGTGSWTQLTTVGLVSTNLANPVSNGSGTVLAAGGVSLGNGPIFVSTDTMASCWGINRITTGTGTSKPIGDATTAVSIQATDTTDITYIIKRSGINFRTKQITSGVNNAAAMGAAWNGSVYVLSIGTAAKSSPDGVTWTARTLSTAASAALAALTTTGRFIGFNGSATTTTTSTDGVTWSAGTAMPAVCSTLLTNGSTLLAMTSSTPNTYYTSTDGVAWTTRTFPSNLQVSYTAITSDKSSTFSTGVHTASNGLQASYFSTDGINWTLRYLPSGAGTAIYGSCAAGIWTDRAVTFDAGVTWYINHTIAGLQGTVAHNCLSMSMASTAVTTIDGTTLLTGVDAAIVSTISGSSSSPAIPNFVRVA